MISHEIGFEFTYNFIGRYLISQITERCDGYTKIRNHGYLSVILSEFFADNEMIKRPGFCPYPRLRGRLLSGSYFTVRKW